MIDVDIATVTQILAVIFRIPITRHDITAVRVNLRLRNTVALENFFAGVAPIAVKIRPVDKQTALVASFIFIFDFYRRKHRLCVIGNELGADFIRLRICHNRV